MLVGSVLFKCVGNKYDKEVPYMRIEQLQYLVAIADTKSFTLASEQLYITQPSISQSITALEKELGVTLLLRTRMGAEPTAIGAEIIQEARVVLKQIERINDLAARETQTLLTSLTVVAAPLITNTILPKAILQMDKSTVSQLNIVQNTTRKAEQMILNEQADLAVVPYVQIPDRSALVFRPLLEVQTMALVRRNSILSQREVLSFQDIQQYPVALFGNEFISFDHILARIQAFGPANIVLKTSSPEMVKQVSLQSDYVGLAYDLSILNHPHVVSGELIAIPITDPVEMTFGILSKKDTRIGPLTKKLAAALVEKSRETESELAALHAVSL